jgi:chemotaxis protein methyltransferase CheR
MGYSWQGFRKPRFQVLKRIRNRMHELGFCGGYEEYQRYLNEHPAEWNHLDRLCNVTISKFFRDRKLWDFLRDDLLPGQLRAGPAGAFNIWSAGCCNGEEPYSIAIVIEQLSMERPAGRNISILASDRDPQVLERARRGRFPAGALKDCTDSERTLYFHNPENANGDFAIKEHLTRYIEFEQRDLTESLPDRVFDLVFCRNLVFTYFSKERQQQFLIRLRPHLKPLSHLVIGSNENLPATDWLETARKSHPVYRVHSKVE